MTPHWLAHALYILGAIETLEKAASKGESYLASDELVYRGVLQALQTLSESAYKLPEDIKQQHTSIPWSELRIMRNIFAHDYLAAPTCTRLIEIVQYDLPPLKKALLEHIPNWEDIKHKYRYTDE